MIITELKPIYSNQKSFYRKAEIIYTTERAYLKSYGTIVASIDNNGNFYRHWDGYSLTTANHINDFRQQNGLDKITKKDLERIKVEPY